MGRNIYILKYQEEETPETKKEDSKDEGKYFEDENWDEGKFVAEEGYHVGKFSAGWQFLFDLDFLEQWRDDGDVRYEKVRNLQTEILLDVVEPPVPIEGLTENDILDLLWRSARIVDENGEYIGVGNLVEKINETLNPVKNLYTNYSYYLKNSSVPRHGYARDYCVGKYIFSSFKKFS